jgi:hypothetical protein
MDERRKSLRWKGSLCCRFEWEKESQTGQIVNLSIDGALVSDSLKLPETNREIELTIRPDRENVTLKARVIYVSEDHFGVEFCGNRSENLIVLKPFFQL